MLPLSKQFACFKAVCLCVQRIAVKAHSAAGVCPERLACHAPPQAPADTQKAAEADYTDRIKRATAGARIAPAAAAAGVSSASTKPADQALGYSR